MIKYETNSKKVRKGQIFVAISGHTVDGHDYVDEAIKNGAEQIIAEREVESSVPVLIVTSTEEYLKEALVKEYSEDLKKLTLVGVTGTNGKTTTCYLTYQLLNKLGVKTAYIGTMGYYVNEEQTELSNTTPDILTLYTILFDALEKGCNTVVMEVSSHALSLHRLEGLQFKIGAFTNLTEDHLDFYHTMENYLDAKLEFVDYLLDDGEFIVNMDDEAGVRFIEKAKQAKTLGMDSKNDFVISDFTISPDYTDIQIQNKENRYYIRTNLISKFNVYNYVMAFMICSLLGCKEEEIVRTTKDIYPPKGRCETYPVKNGFAVVDYAHTPDAVLKVVSAYKELASARVITLVGCGGDRDPLKRPIMGRIATEESDYVILTSDNPRTEDPEKIMGDIVRGVSKDNYEVILDRRKAIQKGLDLIEKDDIFLILGKGHENYQILGHEKIHFDDSEEIKKYCEKNAN